MRPEFNGRTRGIETVVELVAQSLGSTIEDLEDLDEEHSFNPAQLREALDAALDQDLVIEMAEKYWVMRTGKYAFDEYDHPV